MSKSRRDVPFEELSLTEPSPDADVIVLKKSWVIAGGIGIVAFVLGGLGGYLLASSTYERSAAILAANQIQQGAGAPQVQPTQPPARIDNVSEDDDPSLGPQNAKVVVVEFSDFQCPFCQRFVDQTMGALVDQYGDDLRIVYRDFPLSSIHPEAQKAAEAAECADEQGEFWAMHDLIFANQATMGIDTYIGFAGDLDLDVQQFENCVNNGKYQDEVLADLREGQSYGVTGTPTFFINGVRLVGAQPIQAFQAIIDEELGR